jgi:hypothetical protein
MAPLIDRENVGEILKTGPDRSPECAIAAHAVEEEQFRSS